MGVSRFSVCSVSEVVACVDRVRIRRGGLCVSLGCVWLGRAPEILNVFTFHPTLEKSADRGVTHPVCLDRSICMARPRLWMLHWARVWAQGSSRCSSSRGGDIVRMPWRSDRSTRACQFASKCGSIVRPYTRCIFQ